MPKTKTEMIATALLDAVDQGVGPESVLARYQGSKGPLYLALASVLETLRGRTDAAVAELTAREMGRKAVAAEVGALDARRRDTEATLSQLTKEVKQLEGRRASLDGEITAAATLARRGFGSKELDRLATLLASVAASQGAPPEEGVAQFFATISRYENVVAFDLEVRCAEARAATARAECARCEAELRQAEAQSRARRETIAVMERLLSQGVKPDDLPRWERILATAEMSAARFGAAMKRYGSLAALARGERAQVEKLRRDSTRLRRQVEALERERAGITGELAAVRDTAVTAMQRLVSDAKRQIADLHEAIAGYGVLREEAARLEAKLALAEMLELKGDERARRWSAAPLTLIADTLLGLIAWAEACGADDLKPPEALARRYFWLNYKTIPAADLLRWFSAAVVRGFEEEAMRTAAS